MLFSSFLLPFSVLAAGDNPSYAPSYVTGWFNLKNGDAASISDLYYYATGPSSGGMVRGYRNWLAFSDDSGLFSYFISSHPSGKDLGEVPFGNAPSGYSQFNYSQVAGKTVQRVSLYLNGGSWKLASGTRYAIFLNFIASGHTDWRYPCDIELYDQSSGTVYTDEQLGVLERGRSYLIFCPVEDIDLNQTIIRGANMSYTFPDSYDPNNVLTVYYYSLQAMPGVYRQGEADEIIAKLEEGQQEQQQQHEETKGLLGSIIDGILSLPQKIIDLLSDLLKTLFVPDDTFIQDWVNDLQTWFETKFGVLALPFTLMTTLIGAFSSAGTGDVSLVFPGFSIMGYEVWANQSVDMATILQPFSILVTSIRTVLGILLIGAFIKYLQTLYDKVLGVGT